LAPGALDRQCKERLCGCVKQPGDRRVGEDDGDWEGLLRSSRTTPSPEK
jgi:hypothetical protein